MRKFLKFIAILGYVIAIPILTINGIFLYTEYPKWGIFEFIVLFFCFSVALYGFIIPLTFFSDTLWKDQEEINEYKSRLSDLEKKWKNKLYE